jgi:hypothetical protein
MTVQQLGLYRIEHRTKTNVQFTPLCGRRQKQLLQTGLATNDVTR